MLEIAGGIVLGGVVLFILWLFLPLIAEGLSRLAEGLIAVVVVLLVVGLAYASTVPAYAAWVWLKGRMGPVAAHAVVDPLTIVVFVGGPFLLFADSQRDFAQTRRLFHWLTRKKNRLRLQQKL